MDEQKDGGMGRRDLLHRLGWAGAGALYAMSGGIATSISLDAALANAGPRGPKAKAFTFLADQ